jgi:hypothetical protein
MKLWGDLRVRMSQGQISGVAIESFLPELNSGRAALTECMIELSFLERWGWMAHTGLGLSADCSHSQTKIVMNNQVMDDK